MMGSKITLDKVFEWLVIIFVLSIFTSKSGLVGTIPALVMIGSILVIKKKMRLPTVPKIWIVTYISFLVLNLFSLGGMHSAFKWLRDGLVFLLPMVSWIALNIIPRRKHILIATLLSGVIGVGFVWYQFITIYRAHYQLGIRLSGFWDVLRWGMFVGWGFLTLFAIFSEYLPTQVHDRSKRVGRSITYWILWIVCIIFVGGAVILSGSRAPWLGLIGSFFIFFVLQKKARALLIPILVTFLLLVAFNDPFRQRFFSAFNIFKDHQGRLSSEDGSNQGRLFMWQVGIKLAQEQLWFGTGYENLTQPLKAYFEKHPELEKQFVTGDFSFNDQHSTYLSILVEHGLIAFFIFIVALTYTFFHWGRKWLSQRDAFSAYVIAVLVFHAIIFIFYTSYSSYEMTTLFPLLGLEKDLIDQNKNSTN